MADQPARDRRARDVLAELGPRRTPGERLMARVGRRAWGRARVACGARIFRKYGLADPFDPESKEVDPVDLGPVALRLGEPRREPAPHLQPKPPAPKEKPPDPLAKWRRPEDTAPRVPKREAKPAPEPPRPPPPSPTEGLFGPTTQVPGLKGKLPVRPDLAAVLDQQAEPARTAAKAAPVDRAPPKPAGPRLVARREPAAARRAPEAPAPPEPPPNAGQRLPGLPPPRERRKPTPGRISARPVETVQPDGFEEILIDEAPAPPPAEEPVVVEAPEPAPPPPKPVDRSMPKGPMGLDDLFGVADAGGRMSFRRKKKDDEGSGGP